MTPADLITVAQSNLARIRELTLTIAAQHRAMTFYAARGQAVDAIHVRRCEQAIAAAREELEVL